MHQGLKIQGDFSHKVLRNFQAIIKNKYYLRPLSLIKSIAIAYCRFINILTNKSTYKPFNNKNNLLTVRELCLLVKIF